MRAHAERPHSADTYCTIHLHKNNFIEYKSTEVQKSDLCYVRNSELAL